MEELVLKFRHGFLVATWAHREHPYHESVIYICEHSPQGSLGLILNKRLDLSLADLTKKYSPATVIIPTYLGGAVQTQERGFVLHRDFGKFWQGTTQLATDLYLTSTNDILDDIYHYHEDEYRIILGYTGWRTDQLEEEIAKDYWLFLPYDSSLIFSPPEQLWHASYKALGFDPHQIVCVDPGFGLVH
jgi:putative transcriptional regulator